MLQSSVSQCLFECWHSTWQLQHLLGAIYICTTLQTPCKFCHQSCPAPCGNRISITVNFVENFSTKLVVLAKGEASTDAAVIQWNKVGKRESRGNTATREPGFDEQNDQQPSIKKATTVRYTRNYRTLQTALLWQHVNDEKQVQPAFHSSADCYGTIVHEVDLVSHVLLASFRSSITCCFGFVYSWHSFLAQSKQKLTSWHGLARTSLNGAI